MPKILRYLFFYSTSFFFFSCAENESVDRTKNIISQHKVFEKLNPDSTKISFVNKLDESADFDVFRYRNYYNGGGVAIGDIDNDGLDDIYFVSNTSSNKLYKNLGDFKFKDITEQAKVQGKAAWSTGVAMADVNGDGWLDIYVCNSGNIHGDERNNELFINQQDGTFNEAAAQYGLDDQGYSTHAAFFDFDKDGDLDCYILNNSFRPIATLGYRNLRNERDKLGGDKLMENVNGKFVDISEEAGIYGSVIGFGLGIAVGDVNEDQWLDIYISNDFYERDYLYINNQDGTFTEMLTEMFGKTSLASMGADIADINNDGKLDIFSTDMLPESDVRLKRTTSFESFDLYQRKLANDLYHQNMRNMLQLNMGNGTFVDIGQLADVAASDWSWGALMADFDNDSYKEIFVANGVNKDVTDQDFIDYIANNENIQAAVRGEKVDFSKFISRMPSHKLKNYLFKKDSSLFYNNMADDWGLGDSTFSNGAAYGDLDNDGDLDLVVNNLNHESFIYQNQTSKVDGHYIKFKLNGTEKNPFAVGTKIKIYVDDEIIIYEHIPTRGFQSSMSYVVTMGVGRNETLDSVKVYWPQGKMSVLYEVKSDALYALNESEAKKSVKQNTTEEKHQPIFSKVNTNIPYEHQENEYIDFDEFRLLYNMNSREGPAMAAGDIDDDGFEEIYLGGAAGQAAKLLRQVGTEWQDITPAIFANDAASEDTDAIFFDADQDGDLDLYVVSGGSEFSKQAPALADRLYINTSTENDINFVKSIGRLPGKINGVGSVVKVIDYDSDGDLDIFLGERMVADAYGLPASGYLFENNNGKFSDVTQKVAPFLTGLGLITDAVTIDYNGDNLQDLVLVGEWMAPTFLLNNNGKFSLDDKYNSPKYKGWFNAISVHYSQSGRINLLVGNLGLNSRFKASEESPLKLYISDFDENGTLDHVYTYFQDGKELPMTLKRNLEKQIPKVKKRFTFFKDYAGKPIDSVFTKEELNEATVLEANYFSTSIIELHEDGLQVRLLPIQAQISPVYCFVSLDANGDGLMDVMSFGNFYHTQPEIGRYDGNQGQLYIANKDGSFNFNPQESTGIILQGEIRAAHRLKSGNILLVRNNDTPILLEKKLTINQK
ncbi:MAG: VCBS repeat-containing protein [Fulvivirga sp.]|nr:VCBS repeat-containing protein [Fulvivirga sp.]